MATGKAKAETGVTGLKWDVFLLRMQFEGRIMGAVPMERQIVKGWLETKAPTHAPEGARPLDELAAEVEQSTAWVDDVEETESTREDPEGMKRVTSVFQKHPEKGYLAVRAGTIRAHLKDCARQLFQAKQVNVPVFRSKVANFVYVKPYWVPIVRTDGENGHVLRKPDGWDERPIHVITMQGPRSALKKSMFVEDVELWTVIGLLQNPFVKPEHLELILTYGGIHGYGAERSLGEGQYEHELIPIGTDTQIPSHVLDLGASLILPSSGRIIDEETDSDPDSVSGS